MLIRGSSPRGRSGSFRRGRFTSASARLSTRREPATTLFIRNGRRRSKGVSPCLQGSPMKTTSTTASFSSFLPRRPGTAASLREIDWSMNWSEREAILKRWQEWHEVHHQKQVEHYLVGDEGEDEDPLARLIDGYKLFKAAYRARVNLSALLPAPLADSNVATEDGQTGVSLSEVE